MPPAAFSCCLRDASGVGADAALSAGVCVGETGLLVPMGGGPVLGTSSSHAADGICKVHSVNSA